MGDKTAIEWTDATWNPVSGCTKVSQGCKNCYAERVFPRAYAKTGRKFTDVQTHPDRLEQPLRWKKPRRIFVNSMSDLFHEDVPDIFLDRVFTLMALAQQHQFQVLTKRPQRMKSYLANNQTRDRWVSLFARAEVNFSFKMIGDDLPGIQLPNVQLGVSAEDQPTANERIPLLLQTPAAVRFVSLEPLIAPVSFRWARWHNYKHNGDKHHLDGMKGIDWIIAGGESGPGARPMHPDWVRSLRDQCIVAGVPFFFKQWGEWAPIQYRSSDSGKPLLKISVSESDGKERCIGEPGKPETYCNMRRVGKKAAGAVLDGREWREFPGRGE